MESNIRSSFIPKDAGNIGASIRTPNGSSGIFDLLVLVAVVFLVASVALGIGVFLYVEFLQTSLTSKKQQLARAQDAFEPTLIAELTRLDDRLKASQTLLDRHVAPSIVFDLLEQLTLETVSFSNFSFDATQAEGMKVTMQGVAQSVNSIALQADLIAKHQAFSSPIFSNINRDRDFVRFDLAVDVNPTAIRYVNILNQGAAAAAATLPQNFDFNNAGFGTVPADIRVPTETVESQDSTAPESIPNFAP